MTHHHPSQVELVEEFARLDIHRAERTGIPEAIFAEGKTNEQVVSLVRSMVEKSGIALATRVTDECAKALSESLGSKFKVHYNQLGRTFLAKDHKYNPKSSGGKIAIFAAGTADLRVAEEAKVTAETMGCDVTACYDVGIAGIHRLMEPLKLILEKEVSAVVVVAGMEGALPSVVRGLVPMPVIGVPVSTGYGYGGKGEGALMTMLQSCAPGLTVVNIDNGFGAGATAALIANQVARAKGERKE
ncbi:MAG: nickel pincer cofactor biosynthesis protein LarB [Ignavibacteriales bacterium]|nr:nickel pincer cofactor biosynthesis protein LarB [Ignavibacteriales bacterium]